jgi:hypothetical protein
MKYVSYLGAALAAYLSGTASFRLGPFTITVSVVGGGPIHLTLAAVFLAVEKALAGQAGTFQSGSIQIVLTPYVAP